MRARSITPSGSFHVRKSANWSAPMRKSGSFQRPASEQVDGALVGIELDLVVGERGPRELQPRLGVELDLLVARLARRRGSRARRDRMPPGLHAASATCPLCGGLNVPPSRPVTGPPGPRRRPRPRRLCARRPPSAQLRAPPRRQALRRRSGSRVGAQDPEATAARPRPVDEEVDEPVLRGLLATVGRRAELEQRTPELLDARAGRARDAEHTHDRARPRARRQAAPARRSILFRTTACGRSRARRRTRRARDRSSRNARPHRLPKSRSRATSRFARSRCARNS